MTLTVYRYIDAYVSLNMYICCHFKPKTEAQAIFLILFTVCSLWKQKFVVCPFVYGEVNGSYPFKNGL
jgi:hypothetical protein